MASKAQGIRAGRAYVELGTSDVSLTAGLKAAEAQLKSFGASVARIGAAVAGIGTAITVGFAGAAKSFADTGSELNDMSARTGMSVESLSALGHAAGMTGADLAAVEVSSKKLSKAITSAAEGSSEAQFAFAKLGLDFRRLLRLSPDQQFEAVAKAIGRVQNPTLRAGAALELFGKSGTALLPMIQDFDALTNEAKRFGLVFTTDEAQTADALGDSIDLLTATAVRFYQVIGSAVAPVLTELATTMAAVAASAVRWAQDNKELIVTVFKVGAGIAVAGAAIIALGTVIAGLGAVIGALLSPLGAIVAALATGAAAFFTFSEAGQEAFQGIADALKAGDIALAAQVLWAGIKVEFAKGILALDTLWADWGVATAEVFSGVSYKISGIMVDLVTGLKVIWAELVSGFTGTWGDMIKTLLVTLNPLAKALEAIGVDVSGLVDAGMKAVGLTQSSPDRLQNDLAGIGQENIDRRKALEDQQKAEQDARRQGAGESLKGSEDALAKAQQELAALTTEAKSAAEMTGAAATKNAGGPGVDIEGAAQSLEKAKSTVDVVGTFSAGAVRGLGGQSVTDAVKDVNKEQKKTNENLFKIQRTLESAGRLA